MLHGKLWSHCTYSLFRQRSASTTIVIDQALSIYGVLQVEYCVKGFVPSIQGFVLPRLREARERKQLVRSEALNFWP